MDKTTILYLSQTDSMECFQILLKIFSHNKKLFLSLVKTERLKRNPWKSIKNPSMLSGNEIWLLSPKQLLITEDHYAFDFGDIDYLLEKKINPFNQKKLSPTFIKKLKKAKTDWRYKIRMYPLDMAYSGFMDPKSWCVPNIEMINTDPKRCYYHTYTIFSLPLQNALQVSKQYIKTTWHYEYIYEIHLKFGHKALPSKFYITKEDIESIKLIHNPFQNIVPYQQKNINFIPEQSIITAIQKYHHKENGRTSDIPKHIIQEMMKLPLRPKKSFMIFRGMYNAKHIFETPIRVGDNREISFTKPSSWTVNRCMAEVYASYMHRYGVVISIQISPENVIIDSRYLDNEWIKSNLHRVVFVPVQDEVLVRPGTYVVKIENIIYSHKPHGYNSIKESINRVDLTYGWNY